MNQYRQTQDSMAIVGAIAGGVFLLIIVALMVVGSYGFSAALFLAGGVAAIVAVVLVVGFHEKPRHPNTGKSKPAAKVAAAPAPAPAAAATAAPAPTQDGAPKGLEAARDGQADDLKKIKGIGPQLETLLNGMGFYHYDQIAAWTDKELAWVDENIEGFKGRASRDEWIKQAKALANS